MLFILLLFMGKPDPGPHLETSYNVVRLADYPNGPNTLGCEDSVEVFNGLMTYVRFEYDIYKFVLHGELRFIKDENFPYPSTMLKAYSADGFKPQLLPFNSLNSLNGCHHLYKENLYFHSELFATKEKRLLIGNIQTGRVTKAGFYGDNPFVNKDNPSIIYFDKDNDIWVASKGFWGWNIYNFNVYYKTNLNTNLEEVQPYYTNGEVYFTRNYKEIWKYNIKSKTYTLLVKLKPNDEIVAIGEPSFDKKLYFLIVYKDGTNYDADIVEGSIK